MGKDQDSKELYKNIPITIKDTIEDIAIDASNLEEAISCVCLAVKSNTEDSEDYIEGTLAVLLAAADDLAGKASKLVHKVE